ncbi:hypothetical protein ABPG72_011615 [Tetrahymena utriculariae]
MSENVICLICLDICKEPKICNGCKNQFCKLCVLQWMEKQNMCPLRCSQKWEVDLNDINERNSQGYFICAQDQKVGSVNCKTCKKGLVFNKLPILNKYYCKCCQSRLKFFESTSLNHESCDYLKLFYFYCLKCDIKMCDCIMK